MRVWVTSVPVEQSLNPFLQVSNIKLELTLIFLITSHQSVLIPFYRSVISNDFRKGGFCHMKAWVLIPFYRSVISNVFKQANKELFNNAVLIPFYRSVISNQRSISQQELQGAMRLNPFLQVSNIK